MITPPEDLGRKDKLAAFDRMLTIMDELRLNCPWDKKQTYESLSYLTIEEVYELNDAIIEKDTDELKKEIGDVFLHLLFYSKIASEEKKFDIKDVLDSLAEKMIRRHPHIYSDEKVESEEEVKANWEKIKLKEGGSQKKKKLFDGVPKSLPAMVKAVRIQQKARGIGFDWDEKEQVWDKVQEELQEFKEAPTKEEREKEFGDVLFSMINYARFVDIDPEQALEKTNKKFVRRFTHMEEAIQLDGKDLSEMNLNEMDLYWNKAKKKD